MENVYLFDLEKEIKPYIITLFASMNAHKDMLEKIKKAKKITDLQDEYEINEQFKIKIKVTSTTISIEKEIQNKSNLVAKIFFNINCTI